MTNEDNMGFRKLGGVAYCTDKDCGQMFEITSSEAFQKMMMGEKTLPCGHDCDRVTLSATALKSSDNAVDMIDWLIAHDSIRASAFIKIREKGGTLEDGLNCRVPKE